MSTQITIEISKDELNIAIYEYLLKHKKFKATQVGVVVTNKGIVLGAQGVDRL